MASITIYNICACIHTGFYLGSWPSYLNRVRLVKAQLPMWCVDGERGNGIVRKDLHGQLRHAITKVSLSFPSMNTLFHLHSMRTTVTNLNI